MIFNGLFVAGKAMGINMEQAIATKDKKLTDKAVKIMTAIISVLPFFSLFMAKWQTDSDTYWILKTGEYICKNGIPTKDFLTFHTDMDLVVQQWLSDVIYYKLYSLMGFFGPMLLVLVMYCIFIVLFKKLCLQISNKPIVASFATFAAALAMLDFFVTRPQIFTYCIILIELICLEKFIKSQSVKYLIPLPILSILVVNLHASMWTMLFIVILPYLANALPIKIKGKSIACCKLMPLVIVMVIMAVCGLITPYGIKGLSFLFTTSIGDKVNSSISELKPLTLSLSFSSFSDFFELGVILAIYIFYKKGKTNLRYVLLTVGTALMMMMYLKLIPYFIICAIPSTLKYIDNIDYRAIFKKFVQKDQESRKNDSKDNSKGLIKITAVLIIVFSVGIVGLLADSCYQQISDFVKYDGGSKITVELDKTIDKMQADIDQNNVTDLKLYNGFNTGGYLEFKGYTTYIDARADSFVKEANHEYDYLTEYLKVSDGKKNYKKMFEKYGFNYAIIDKSSEKPLYVNLKNDDDYQLIHKSKHYAVFKKIK